MPRACVFHKAEQLTPRPSRTARRLHFALVFYGDPGLVCGSMPDQGTSPTLVRLALPRPLNLDSQYQSLREWCQEKIAKSSQLFLNQPISCGGVANAQVFAWHFFFAPCTPNLFVYNSLCEFLLSSLASVSSPAPCFFLL